MITDKKLLADHPIGTPVSVMVMGQPRIGIVQGLSTEHTGYYSVRFRPGPGFAECVHASDIIK